MALGWTLGLLAMLWPLATDFRSLETTFYVENLPKYVLCKLQKNNVPKGKMSA